MFAYSLTAHYKPDNWRELSPMDKKDMALANPDPSTGDLNIARAAIGEQARLNARVRFERNFIQREIYKRVSDSVTRGAAYEFDDFENSYAEIANRHKEFVEKAIKEAKQRVSFYEKEKNKLGIDIQPVEGTFVSIDERQPIPEITERNRGDGIVDQNDWVKVQKAELVRNNYANKD
jgi:hypothetical protein